VFVSRASRLVEFLKLETVVGLMKQVVVFGLGYVGLPLALQLSRHRKVIGYDSNKEKIKSYKLGVDPSGECERIEFTEVEGNLYFTDRSSCLDQEKIVIVTVPTPIDSANVPDLQILKSACEIIGRSLFKGDVVIFESTVYPGATEEVCVPILENSSGLVHFADFNVGYSPERINPGDKERGLGDVVKIISGDCDSTLSIVEAIYEPIIDAGLHRAPSIRVAEAAKVIENTQRDLNIALMNELAVICDKLGIITSDVLEAAQTKWNFLRFSPGLVGGHCIGVDPYYLTHKAHQVGYHPEVILAGRRINDAIANFIAEKIVKQLLRSKSVGAEQRALIMGMTFKENVKDTRNSKAFDLKSALEDFGVIVETCDPVADKDDAITFTHIPSNRIYDTVILAVPHDQFVPMHTKVMEEVLSATGILFDVKGLWKKELNEIYRGRYFTL